MRTIGEALDQGVRVFWYAPRPGEPATASGSNNVLWWQDGRNGKERYADHHGLPDVLRALKDLLSWANIHDLASTQARQVRDNAIAAIEACK